MLPPPVSDGTTRPAGIRVSRMVGVVAALGLVALAASACVPVRVDPTPIIVVVTPAPTPTPVDTPAEPATPTPIPTLGPTPVVVGPSGTPTPDGSSVATASHSAPIAVATPAPASVCSGSAANKTFWGQVARQLSWDVYCAVLPAGWAIKTGSYNGTSPGDVAVTYAGPGGATLQLKEGAYCTVGATTCAPHTAELGSAYFGNLSGSLDAVSGGFAVYVNPGTRLGYSLTSTGLSQDAFVSLASALVRVAK